MEKLDLSKCITNEEVCKLVSERVKLLSYDELLEKVKTRFVYQDKATKGIYTGLLMNMNVFLSGPGGYGKSELIKFILDIYGIPYTFIVGYKDMPVDALLGIPDMDKLLKESKYEINFKESIFYKPGIVVAEEFTDILPSTAAALKNILTERGYRDKNGKIESLVSTMIIAANKSSDEMSGGDESRKAFYNDRFPIKVEVKWVQFKPVDYFNLLEVSYPKVNKKLLHVMSGLFANNHEEHGNTISPRTALAITDVYLSTGLRFIENFSINMSNIENIKRDAEAEFNRKSIEQLLDELESLIEGFKGREVYREVVLYAYNKINALKVGGDLLLSVIQSRDRISVIINSKDFSTPDFSKVDEIFKGIDHGKTSS